MATVDGKLGLEVSLAWELAKAVTGFDDASHEGAASFSAAPDAATWTQVQFGQFTLAAAASSSLDLRSFTSALGESVTATGVLMAVFAATGDGGQLRLAPGASNGIDFWLGGTSPTLTLDCGADGCVAVLGGGSSKTLSATKKTIDVSNPGSATITVSWAALVKTA